jgi:hypothetical protein
LLWAARPVGHQQPVHAFLFEQGGIGEFLANDFKKCIEFKLAKIIESIQQNPGGIILWA